MAEYKKVTLNEVTADNWEVVAKLRVKKGQKDFVAANLYSIAESKFNPHAVPLAIYAGQKPVGFLMYETCFDEGRPHDYLIFRFMIDKKHQGRGYGQEALEGLLEIIRKDTDWRRILICYLPRNKAARSFYLGFGFVETGVDEDGEIIAEIRNKSW